MKKLLSIVALVALTSMQVWGQENNQLNIMSENYQKMVQYASEGNVGELRQLLEKNPSIDPTKKFQPAWGQETSLLEVIKKHEDEIKKRKMLILLGKENPTYQEAIDAVNNGDILTLKMFLRKNQNADTTQEITPAWGVGTASLEKAVNNYNEPTKKERMKKLLELHRERQSKQ